jgi:2-C-methyl-D-erythritol 4-phosphate cytidylyltransferase
MNDPVIAIIVAAGRGLRMNDPVRKQYHTLAGQPIIVHTLRRFDTYKPIDQLIVVIPEDDVEFCRDKIINPSQLAKRIMLVAGGERRQDSVYNALKEMDQKGGIVVIHDGVRPFISHADIAGCIAGARKYGACILGVPADDTLKHAGTDKFVLNTLQREGVWLVQTPQAFQSELIKNAHEQARKDGFTGTDDASIVEWMNKEVKIIRGSRTNIKITYQDDLKLAVRLLESECWQQ